MKNSLSLLVLFATALSGCVSTAAIRLPASDAGQAISHEDYLQAYELVKPDNDPMPQLSPDRKDNFERQRKAFGLTVDEADAIFAYTARFYHVNQDLRSAHPSRAALIYAAVIDEGLEKLPPYQGTVYRNIWPFPGYKEHYREGAVVTESAFTSTSLEPGDGPMMSDREPIRFVISSLDGRNISAFSAHGKTETEILFKTGTRFRVTSVNEVNDFKNWDGQPLSGLEFRMEELPEHSSASN